MRRLWRFLNTHDFVVIARGRWVWRWLPKDGHGRIRVVRLDDNHADAPVNDWGPGWRTRDGKDVSGPPLRIASREMREREG